MPVFAEQHQIRAANLVEGDQVYLVANRSGAAQFVKATGIVTESDVMSKITDLSRDW